jgi:hypothetical protein
MYYFFVMIISCLMVQVRCWAETSKQIMSTAVAMQQADKQTLSPRQLLSKRVPAAMDGVFYVVHAESYKQDQSSSAVVSCWGELSGVQLSEVT